MYNYYEAVLNDVKNYINDEINIDEWQGKREELEEQLNEDLWIDDSVTGNGSGTYTFNTYQAEENLCHNWDILAEALECFGENGTDILKQGAEAMDVTIRCYYLSQAINEVLDDLENAEEQ